MKETKAIKKVIKRKNGITLIALVITIIVLLILAGISISMLSGDNSILQRATDAKINTERAEAKEQAQMDIMAYIADKTSNHQDASLDDEKIQEILSDNKSYVKEAKATSFITGKGEYEIPYSELYQLSNVPPSTEYIAYTIGQIVTVSGESFYVIEDSDTTKSTVKLLAKECIDTANLVQSENANSVSFSTTNYWINDEEVLLDKYGSSYPADLTVDTDLTEEDMETKTALYIAQQYGKKLQAEKGTLLTKLEAENLFDISPTLQSVEAIINQTVDGYWLGTAYNKQDVYINSSGNPEQFEPGLAKYKPGKRDGSFGVRPVITIEKVLISN